MSLFSVALPHTRLFLRPEMNARDNSFHFLQCETANELTAKRRNELRNQTLCDEWMHRCTRKRYKWISTSRRVRRRKLLLIFTFEETKIGHCTPACLVSHSRFFARRLFMLSEAMEMNYRPGELRISSALIAPLRKLIRQIPLFRSRSHYATLTGARRKCVENIITLLLCESCSLNYGIIRKTIPRLLLLSPLLLSLRETKKNTKTTNLSTWSLLARNLASFASEITISLSWFVFAEPKSTLATRRRRGAISAALVIRCDIRNSEINCATRRENVCPRREGRERKTKKFI